MGKNKITQLQGLRGLAMIGIFLMHTQTFWSSEGFGNMGEEADNWGRIGVIAFFMLSGFLLTYKGKNIPILSPAERLNACWMKFNKLRLLYILTLVIAFFGYGRIPQSLVDWCYAIVSLPLCLTYTQDLIPHVGINISYNGPSWYISALFIIWIIVYTFPKNINIIRTLTVHQTMRAIILLILIQIVYKIGELFFPVHLIPINHSNIYMAWISYYSPFYNFGYFILGCFLGRLILLQAFSRFFPSILLLVGMVIMYAFWNGNVILNLFKPLLFEIFIGVLMLSIMSDRSILKYIISVKPLVRFGNVSASFFLIHGVVNYHLRYVEDIVAKPFLFFLSFFMSLGLSIISEKYLILKKDESILQRIKKIA